MAITVAYSSGNPLIVPTGAYSTGRPPSNVPYASATDPQRMFKAGNYWYLVHNCNSEPAGAITTAFSAFYGNYWYWTTIARAPDVAGKPGTWTDDWCKMDGSFYANSRPAGKHYTTYYDALPNMRDITTILFGEGKWHLWEPVFHESGNGTFRYMHCTNPSTDPDNFPTTGWLYPTDVSQMDMIPTSSYTGDYLDPDTGTATSAFIYPDIHPNPAGGWVLFWHSWLAGGKARYAVTATAPSLDGPWTCGSKVLGTYAGYSTECPHYFTDGTYHYLTAHAGTYPTLAMPWVDLWRATNILGPYTRIANPLLTMQSWGNTYIGPAVVVPLGDGTAVGMYYCAASNWVKKIGGFTLSGLELPAFTAAVAGDHIALQSPTPFTYVERRVV